MWSATARLLFLLGRGVCQQAFKQYGAIAAFHINDEAKEEALRRGYFVLQRSGDLVHTESSEHLTVL
ncbi:MAG: hypothetical protein U1E09_00660 [Methylococcales bacterium]|jgi:hypothetical protein|nr:hypothetical protein [Methylococcales bacterium]